MKYAQLTSVMGWQRAPVYVWYGTWWTMPTKSFEAGEERLLHEGNPFPFSIPDLLFFNILTKLVKKTKYY